MMLYKNTKAIVRLPTGDTNFFYIFAGVFEGDTRVVFLLMICSDYVLRMSKDLMKENCLTLKKMRSREISHSNYHRLRK